MTKTLNYSELHEQLRQATKRLHHELDHHPILAPLIRTDLNRVEYGNALASLHGVFAIAEAWVLDFLAQYPLAFDYHCRRKLIALNTDLSKLGRIPIPFSKKYSQEKTIGALIGNLYVLEGATQGGQFIARNLQASPIENLPMQFFRGYGDLSHQRWQEFLEFAGSHCARGDYGEAASSAVSLFKTIRDHLDDCLVKLM